MTFLREQFVAEGERVQRINNLLYTAYVEVGDASEEGHADPVDYKKRPVFYETLHGALERLRFEIDILQAFATRFTAA